MRCPSGEPSSGGTSRKEQQDVYTNRDEQLTAILGAGIDSLDIPEDQFLVAENAYQMASTFLRGYWARQHRLDPAGHQLPRTPRWRPRRSPLVHD